MIDEIELAGGVHRGAGDGKESVFQLFDFGAWSEHGRCVSRRGSGRIRRNVEHRELPLADFEMMGHILDGIFVGEFAGAQKCAAAVVVADGIAAFGIDMHVAEMNVAGVVEANRGGKRRAGARDAIAVIVGDGDVVRPVEFERQRFGTFAGLLFGLRRVDVPVLDVVELDLVADMMLVGELVDMAGRLGVRDIEAGLGEGVRSPDIGECAAAAVGHPEARVLPVPALAGSESAVWLLL